MAKKKKQGTSKKKRKGAKATTIPSEHPSLQQEEVSEVQANPNLEESTKTTEPSTTSSVLSPSFVKILRPNDTDPITNRNESRKTMKYIKFMFLGMTRTNFEHTNGDTGFPLVLENTNADSNDVVNLDMEPSLEFLQMQSMVRQSLNEKSLNEAPDTTSSKQQEEKEEKASTPATIAVSYKYNGGRTTIENQLQWQQSLQIFHIERRQCQRDVLDQFILDTIVMLSTSDPDVQLEGLQKLREVGTYEELYTAIPQSCIPTIVQLLRSKYQDVRQAACETLWALCFASKLCSTSVLDTDFLSIVLSNEFQPNVKAKGTEGALMCRGIGGILSTLAIQMDEVEQHLLENKTGVILCNTIMNATKVGKEHTAPMYGMQILLELSNENTLLLIEHLNETRMLETLLKPPSKELDSSLWKLKLFLCKQMCSTTRTIAELLNNDMSMNMFIKKLFKLGKKMTQTIEDEMKLDHSGAGAVHEEAKNALEACAACANCLWSLAASGVQTFGLEKDEMLYDEKDSGGEGGGDEEESKGSELLLLLLNTCKYDEKTTYNTLGALSLAVEQDTSLIDQHMLDVLHELQQLYEDEEEEVEEEEEEEEEGKAKDQKTKTDAMANNQSKNIDPLVLAMIEEREAAAAAEAVAAAAASSSLAEETPPTSLPTTTKISKRVRMQLSLVLLQCCLSNRKKGGTNTSILLNSILSNFLLPTPLPINLTSSLSSMFNMGSFMHLVASDKMITVSNNTFVLAHVEYVQHMLSTTNILMKHIVVLSIWGASRYEELRRLLGTAKTIRQLIQVGRYHMSMLNQKHKLNQDNSRSTGTGRTKRTNRQKRSENMKGKEDTEEDNEYAMHAQITNAVLGSLMVMLADPTVRTAFTNEPNSTQLIVSFLYEVLSAAPQAKGKLKDLMLSSNSSSLNPSTKKRGQQQQRQQRPQSAASSRANALTSTTTTTTTANKYQSTRPTTAGAYGGRSPSKKRIELGAVSPTSSTRNIAFDQGLHALPASSRPQSQSASPDLFSQLWISSIQLSWLLIRASMAEVIEMVHINLPELLLRLVLSHHHVHARVRGAAASLLQLFMNNKMRKQLAPRSPIKNDGGGNNNISNERHFNELLVITLLLLSTDEETQTYAAQETARLSIGKVMKTLMRTLSAVPILLHRIQMHLYTSSSSAHPHSFAEFGMQAILNLSTISSNQKYLGKIGFQSIVAVATSTTDSMTRTYARRTIINLSKHASNRTRIYKLELKLKKNQTHGKKSTHMYDSDLSERVWKTTGTGPYDTRNQSKRKHAKKKKTGHSGGGEGDSTPRSMFEEWCNATFPKDSTASTSSITGHTQQSQHLQDTQQSQQSQLNLSLQLNTTTTNSSPYNLPSFRPRSPNFLTTWKLSRSGENLKQKPSFDRTIQTFEDEDEEQAGGVHRPSLLHSMRSNVQHMFRGDDDGLSRTKNKSKTKKMSRPKSAVQLRRRTQNLKQLRSRWAPKVDHYETMTPDGLFVQESKDNTSRTIDTNERTPRPDEIINDRKKGKKRKKKKKSRKNVLRTASPEMKVVLSPPMGSGNAVKFADTGTRSQIPAKLCRWEYIEGNRVSQASNWPTYQMPNGEKTHFYETSGGLHDEPIVLSMLPALPLTLESIYHSSLPSIPLSLAPSHDAFNIHEHSKLPSPDLPSTSFLNSVIKQHNNDISFYYYTLPIKKGEDATTESEEQKEEQNETDQKQPEKEEKKRQIKKTDKEAEPCPWNIDTSIFRARALGESDSRDYYEQVDDTAFELDWERCMSKSSFWEYVCNDSLPTPFEERDVVEVHIGSGNQWYLGNITQLNKDGTADVKLDRRHMKNTPYHHIRYVGGHGGGYDGTNDRNVGNGTSTMVFVPKSKLNDVIGYHQHQLRSIVHHSGTTITIGKDIVERPEMIEKAKAVKAANLAQAQAEAHAQTQVEGEDGAEHTTGVEDQTEANTVVEQTKVNSETKATEENTTKQHQPPQEVHEQYGYMLTVTGSVNGVKVGVQLLQQAMKIVTTKLMLKQYYSIGLNAYHFFKATGSGDIFSMQLNEFIEFGHQTNVINSRQQSSGSTNSHSLLSYCDQIFAKVNDELSSLQLHSEIRTQQLTSKFKDFNKDKSIMRFEWQEALLRLADIKYNTGKDSTRSKATFVEQLFQECILPSFKSIVAIPNTSNISIKSNKKTTANKADMYRHNKFYTSSMASILEKNQQNLIALFCSVAGSDIVSNTHSSHRQYLVTIHEWMNMLKELSFLDADFTRREAIFCFTQSTMTVVDDFKCAERACGLTFIEFIECLCRCSELKTIPTNMELLTAGVVDIVGYYDQKIRMGRNRHLFNIDKMPFLKKQHATSKQKVADLDTPPMTPAERVVELLTLIFARIKETKKTSCLRKKKFKKMKRINQCYATNQFDLYSNVYRANDGQLVVEEETAPKHGRTSNGGGGPDYHSKCVTTILPVCISPNAILFQDGGIQSHQGMRRVSRLKGLRGSRSPPRR